MSLIDLILFSDLFGFGITQVMLKAYSWPCTFGSLLAVLKDYLGCQGFESGSAACSLSILPASLSL